MEYLFWKKAEYEQLYNCTFYNYSKVSFEERTHPIIGASFIILFVIFETLYIPSLIVIRQKRFYSQPCYKIMFYVGIVDVVCLCVNGLATGIFMFLGYVHCASPVLIHWLGALGLGLWIAESDVGMILAINRCFEMYNTHVAAAVFGGKKAYFWLMIPTLHGFYAWLCSKSVSFNAILLSWFFNPHVGYYNDDSLTYSNWLHAINNLTVLVVMSILYIIFIILFIRKSNGLQNNDRQTQTLIQVFCICTITAIAAAVYVYEQFFPVSNVYILMGSYAWCCAHGFPSVIYVTMNKTVRKQIVGWIKTKKNAIYTTSGGGGVQPTAQTTTTRNTASANT